MNNSPKTSWLRRLAAAGLLAGPTLLGAIWLLGRLTPGVDPIARPISHLGAADAPYSAAFNGSLALSGLLTAAFAVALVRVMRGRQLPAWPAWFTGAFGLLGLCGSALFHCQAACDDSSLLGALHFLPTTAGLAALLLAMLAMPQALRALGAGPLIERVVAGAGQLAWLSTALYALGAILHDPSLFPLVGLIQRVFMAALALWITLLAAWLYRRIPKLQSEVSNRQSAI